MWVPKASSPAAGEASKTYKTCKGGGGGGGGMEEGKLEGGGKGKGKEKELSVFVCFCLLQLMLTMFYVDANDTNGLYVPVFNYCNVSMFYSVFFFLCAILQVFVLY